MQSTCKKLWPEPATERYFEGFDVSVVEDIESLGKSMGLEVSDDVEELVEDCHTKLTIEELQTFRGAATESS